MLFVILNLLCHCSVGGCNFMKCIKLSIRVSFWCTIIDVTPNNMEHLILSYRSGSTFTGKLLESGDPLNTSYIHEPLRKFTNKLELAWQEEDYYRASKGVIKESWNFFPLRYLPHPLSDLSSTFQSYLTKCFKNQQKKIKIEKTIRLRWHHIEDWISATDIKVKTRRKCPYTPAATMCHRKGREVIKLPTLWPIWIE